MKHLPTAKAIIEWYDSFNIKTGDIEDLLKARQRLSVFCAGIAEQIQRIEGLHKSTYHERRVTEAESFLKEEGTVAEREAKSINRDLRQAEATYEGELKGLKIMLDTYYKVLDAMASQINVMNRI